MLSAIGISAWSLRYASGGLRSDEDVVSAAGRWCLKLADVTLRSNRAFVLKTVTKHGQCLEYATDELKADPEVVLAAVSSHGSAIAHASPVLRAKREFVLRAVRTAYGSSLADLLDEHNPIQKSFLLQYHRARQRSNMRAQICKPVRHVCLRQQM